MQYNDDILNNATSQSGLIKSNWPDLPPAKKRKEQRFFAIDVNDETMATTQNEKLARTLARGLGGVVRFVTINEETLVAESREQKTRFLLGQFTQ